MRIIAVDWSGAKTGAKGKSKLWHAEAQGERLVDLRCWKSRDNLVEYLLELAQTDLIVGLDFAFSAPVWFLTSLDLRSAAELWVLAEQKTEAWLTTCEPPFWGRVRGKKPVLECDWRLTEEDEDLRIGGSRPKSVFQIGGGGQVGTGSLRGWPWLTRLRNGGFSIWPFDNPSTQTIVEIYPRLLTGEVKKSSPDIRRKYVVDRYPNSVTPEHLQSTWASEDAFDAAVSALVMARHQDEFALLPRIDDRTSMLEGLIWMPRVL